MHAMRLRRGVLFTLVLVSGAVCLWAWLRAAALIRRPSADVVSSDCLGAVDVCATLLTSIAAAVDVPGRTAVELRRIVENAAYSVSSTLGGGARVEVRHDAEKRETTAVVSRTGKRGTEEREVIVVVVGWGLRVAVVTVNYWSSRPQGHLRLRFQAIGYVRWAPGEDAAVDLVWLTHRQDGAEIIGLDVGSLPEWYWDPAWEKHLKL